MKREKRVSCSVIIVNYNGKKFLKPCIEALRRQTYTQFEIVLVDNSSSDDSVQFLKKEYAQLLRSEKLKLIESKENWGFAEGNNIGYRAARGEYVVLLNTDTVVDKDWLAEVLKPLKDPQIMIAGSYESARHPALQQHRKDEIFGAVNPCIELMQYPRPRTDPLINFYVSGNGMAMRKKEWEQPFDKNYFAYAEDVYICWLAWLKGKKVATNLDANMFHHGGSTKKQGGWINKVAIFNGTKNQIMNYLIFYEWKNIIRIAPLFAITQIAHVIYNPRKFIVKLKAYFWVIINWFLIMRKRKAIQKQRRVPDKELIRMMTYKFFEPKSLEGKLKRILINMANWFFYCYCFITRLKTREFK